MAPIVMGEARLPQAEQPRLRPAPVTTLLGRRNLPTRPPLLDLSALKRNLAAAPALGVHCHGVVAPLAPGCGGGGGAVEGTVAAAPERGDAEQLAARHGIAENGAGPDWRTNPSALYELGPILGSGTVSVVRRARCRSDGRVVAVKLVCGEDEELQRFTREEFELIRSLRHRSIIQVEALHCTASATWICMEFCAGGSVESHIKHNGPFAEIAARGLGKQLFQGVSYLHRKRIVHRDLKPANLLLKTEALVLKIADFNSAKQTGSGPGASLMLTDRGTPDYCAPELRLGLDWNERVDEWACGLCLFFMQRAKLPLNILESAVVKKLRAGQLPAIEWDRIGGLMRNLIQQCLTLDMHDRPPAMELLLHPLFLVRCCSPAPAAPTLRGGLVDVDPQEPRSALLRALLSPRLKSRAAVDVEREDSGPLPETNRLMDGGVGDQSCVEADDEIGFCLSSSGWDRPERGRRHSTKSAVSSGGPDRLIGQDTLRALAETRCERTMEREAAVEGLANRKPHVIMCSTEDPPPEGASRPVSQRRLRRPLTVVSRMPEVAGYVADGGGGLPC